MTRISEVMSPVAATIFVTQSVEDAAALVSGGKASGGETAVLVLGLSHQPMGLITGAELTEIAARRPGDWKKTRCACLVSGDLDFLRPDDSVEGLIGRYRADGTKPLLVLNGPDPVGIVYPEAVFAWNAGGRSPVWSEFTGASEPPYVPEQHRRGHQQEALGHSP